MKTIEQIKVANELMSEKIELIKHLIEDGCTEIAFAEIDSLKTYVQMQHRMIERNNTTKK